MIKAAIFDFGSVLLKTIWKEADKMFTEKNGFSLSVERKDNEKILEIYLGLHVGKGDFEDFVRALKPGIKDPKKIAEDYKEAYSKFREINNNVLGIIGRLQKMKIRTFGFTDTMKEHYEVNMTSGLQELFEKVFTSFDFGVLKSDRKAFELLTKEMEKVGLKPEECIFIDDKEENIINAKSAGFHAIHYPDFPKTEKLEEEIFEIIEKDK